jgi:CHAT domain-containing protein
MTMQFNKFIITVIVSLLPALIINGRPLMSDAQTLTKTSQIKQTQMKKIFELIGKDKPEITLLTGLSFGTERIQGIFQGAAWIFYADGTFTFTYQSAFLSDSVSGTYKKVGENLEFQGESLPDVDRAFSIDGKIQINEKSFVLDAICTDLGSPQQIVNINQGLTTGKLTQTSKLGPLPENKLTTEQINKVNSDLTKTLNSLGINSSAIKSEIEGIKTGIFEVSITGKTDKGNFGPLPASIFITSPSAGSKNPLAVSLIANPELFGKNGFINLSSQESSEQDTKNIQIQAKKGKISLEVSPSQVQRSATYTLGTDKSSPDFERTALIENGILNLKVEGDKISGDIKISGTYFPSGADEHFSDFKQPSTYEVKIVGKIPTSPPVEKLKATLALNFNGQWDTGKSYFGHLDLQRNGQQVSGTYTGNGGGTITGVIQGNRLDFIWQDRQQVEKGKGFLRSIAGGGKLVGLWTSENAKSEAKTQNIVASWQLPTWLKIDTFSPFDLQELRYLGREIASQHKYEQAALILNPVIVSYLPKQQEKTKAFEKVSIENEREEEGNLITAASYLTDLINCYFNLGDYEQLLQSLDYGLEVQRLLGPDVSASRLFRRLTFNIAKELTEKPKTFETMENGYKRWQQMISGNFGVVGISLEQNKTTQEFIISSVEKNKPAYVAGILPQDVISIIDGKTTQDMDEIQVLEMLRGKPNTPVLITIKRGNQTLNFELIRAKVEVSSSQRQTELMESLTIFSDSSSQVRDESKNYLNEINTLAEKIAQGQEKAVPSLLSVTKSADQYIIRLNQDTNKLIIKQREVFSKQKEALQELDVILSAFKDSERIQDLQIKDLDSREEKMLHLIENDPDLSAIDKQIFGAYYADIMYRLSLANNIKSTKNLIEKIDIAKVFEEDQKRSLSMTSNLTQSMEHWRLRLVKDIDKIQALDQGQSFFTKAIQFLISLNYKEEALVTSENSRARAFADLLAKRLSSNLDIRSIANSPSLEGIKAIAKNENATLVEYSIAKQKDNTKLYIWVVKPTGQIEFRQVDLKESFGESLETLVTRARTNIGVRGRKLSIVAEPIDNQESPEHLQKLHKILIDPIADLLPTDPNDHVIFMPQRELFLVPFPALQDKNGKYLIEKHTILTAPAIQVLDLTQKQRAKVQKANVKGLVIVGNPTMPKVIEKFGDPPVQLQKLPSAETEAIAIAKLLHTKALIGNQATKTAILSQLSQAKIIHLATHGLLEDFQSLEIHGVIALAPSGNDNGLLTASEILDLKLNAELVVLSACDTGRGRITGDGVIGLSRSLITAGVPSVIVSLWSVPDAPTAELMTEFYQNWQEKKLDKAQALRQAMLTTMKTHSNPKDWAAFTLIGEAN